MAEPSNESVDASAEANTDLPPNPKVIKPMRRILSLQKVAMVLIQMLVLLMKGRSSTVFQRRQQPSRLRLPTQLRWSQWP